MEAAFPDGVCDYVAARASARSPTSPWLTLRAAGSAACRSATRRVSVPFGPAGPGAAVERYGGPTRLETAALVSGRDRDASTTVVVARADDFPDALAGAPLATALDAELLLSDASALSSTAAAEVLRVGATHAVLLGGTAALGPRSRPTCARSA